ncbi:MAG: hypothetical protein JO182_00835 [Acidobacteriaceae bacterium]|nr:hypothetical protein [Acidobacteriaceae bacterium]MBV9033006.1 hypothetical protein [Acidobacteriaceae bacterium]MBV9224952.1 hypothetical protein [Acidobacteriaceae bacterium]MBV9307290.1 hypothetical protein [Acidobacteriaceae bacterium]MBV9678429.1 hypothetical protein [Acidobacteriaceae bacterium]
MSGEQTMGGSARTYPNVDAFCDALRDGLRQAADAVTPPEAAMEHFRQSRIEFLMGVRELLNHRIDRMSRPKNAGASVVVE